ncbi:MAG TPA: secretin and TonB N-terminal domain-containing protein [Paraburkholderia sp.]|jgi:hypothetical protein
MPAQPSLRFDIAAQPLAAALEQYGTVSGSPVFFDSSQVAGRTSTAVQGWYAPEAALRILLENTGLTAQYDGTGQADAFVLKAAEAQPAVAAPIAPEGTAAQLSTRYDGLVQSTVEDAFCDTPLLAPGGYRTAISFGIDGDGRIKRARLLHGTGDRDRDLAILLALQRIQLDEAPPPGMAQPLYMVILPRGSASGDACRSRSAR